MRTMACWREQKEHSKAKETEAVNASRWAEAMACADLARPATGPKVWALLEGWRLPNLACLGLNSCLKIGPMGFGLEL